MANDNSDTGNDLNSIARRPTQGSGRWRNLITLGTIAGLVGSGLGWIGHGVGIKYENLPTTGSQYRVAATDCVNAGLVLETSAGGFASGSGIQVITCLSTRDGSVIIESGALLTGRPSSRTFAVSGTTLTMRGTMSGNSTLTLSPLAAQANKMACFKTNGVIGYCTGSGHTNGVCGTGCN